MIRFTGSGGATDAVAARADAVKIHEEFGAFAVIGGPALTSAYAEELSARGVICVNCSGGNTQEWYSERSPYYYSILTGDDQRIVHTVEYVAKRLAGGNAEHAGDPALQTQLRKFGLLYLDSNANSTPEAERERDFLADLGVDMTIYPYVLDLFTLQQTAETVMARLKSDGITTIVFDGDVLAPATFTTVATNNEYFPEWVVTGNVFMGTAAFGRSYDQQQWASAFGIAYEAVRQAPELTYRLYQWHHGVVPPTAETYGAITGPAIVSSGIHYAGPVLTAETFQAGLFRNAPAPSGALTAARISFGDHGIYRGTDYRGIDDYTEVWWDPDAVGPDETNKEGTGLWRYSEGGRRFLPGEWTDQSFAFVDDNAPTFYFEVPEAEQVPDCPSPAG